MNFIKYSSYLYLTLFTVLLSLFFWFGFYYDIPSKIGFPTTTLETVFANYDGPNYMVISKCGYVKHCIATKFSLPQPLEYYPAHFPGFPLLIKYFSLFVNTPKAMLLASLLGSILMTLAIYQFFRNYLSQKVAYYLAIISLFFPARLLVLRLIGAPETLFVALTLFSILFFQKNKYILSAITASLAMTLKSPGIILFMAYFCMAIFDYLRSKNITQIINKYFIFLLGPITIFLIFYFYYLQTGDFFAYFHSGDNIHLNILPYLVFMSNRSWINTIWLEDVLYIFLLSFVGLRSLFQKYRFNLIFVYPFLFVLATIFVAHRDISRYISPTYPFLLLAFNQFFTSKSSKLIFWLLLPALVLFAINFVIGNTAPIADWTPYL
ncbi:MAG: glycosyltransferase family 39 protein [Microgenomates group bacterium]